MRCGQVLSAVLDAGLDQFEQAHAAVGQAGNRRVGPAQRFAAGERGSRPARPGLRRSRPRPRSP